MEHARHVMVHSYRRSWLAATAILLLSFSPLPAQPSPTVVVEDRVTCATCSIVRGAQLRFAAAADTNRIDEVPSAIAQDARGRYIVAFEGRGILQYDRTGRFETRLGRFGRGPAEFACPSALVPLPGDSLLVLDECNRRASVLAADGRIARQVRMAQQFLFPVIRRWPSDLVATGRVGTPAAGGRPLHVISLAAQDVTVGSSFGATASSQMPNNLTNAYELVAADRTGGFVSSNPVRYEVHRWRAPGVLLQTLRREARWFGNPSSGRIGTPTEPPSPRLAGLHVDARGRIWSFTRVAASGWRRAWARFPAGAQEADRSNLDRSLLFDTVVEVIDADRKAVLVRDTLPGAVYHVLPGDDVRVLVQRPRAFDDPEILIETLSLRER
jgi:hypothetical protein